MNNSFLFECTRALWRLKKLLDVHHNILELGRIIYIYNKKSLFDCIFHFQLFRSKNILVNHGVSINYIINKICIKLYISQHNCANNGFLRCVLNNIFEKQSIFSNTILMHVSRLKFHAVSTYYRVINVHVSFWDIQLHRTMNIFS